METCLWQFLHHQLLPILATEAPLSYSTEMKETNSIAPAWDRNQPNGNGIKSTNEQGMFWTSYSGHAMVL